MSKYEPVPIDHHRQVGFPDENFAYNAPLTARPLADSISLPVWKGYVIILIFVVGFGGWASFAPLTGGAIAHGIVSPNSSRRIVHDYVIGRTRRNVMSPRRLAPSFLSC